jgi:hypothetical protein
MERDDEAEKNLERRMDVGSWIGLALSVAGTLAQIAGFFV